MTHEAAEAPAVVPGEVVTGEETAVPKPRAGAAGTTPDFPQPADAHRDGAPPDETRPDEPIQPGETAPPDETAPPLPAETRSAPEEATGPAGRVPAGAVPETGDVTGLAGPDHLEPAGDRAGGEGWNGVLAKFVDDPRGSVTDAAGLVDEAVSTLITRVRGRQADLEGGWQDGDADTERLRTALRGYRAFWDSLSRAARED